MKPYYFRAIGFLGISAALFAVFSALTCALESPSVGAKSAALYCPQNHTFLYEKQADLPLGMASTTKIMTALLALESDKLQETVEIPCSAVGIEGSSLYLKEGEKFSLYDLTVGLMLRSANDAAVAIAKTVSGSVEGFVARMNERAEELGLAHTHFENPHGLDGENHYTTARDLACLTAKAMENDGFRTIVSQKHAVIGQDESERPLVNHNKLLRTYDGAVGVKTGYTKACGRCLVSAAERDGLLLIAVTLDDPDDWRDHAALLDYGFDALDCLTVGAGELRFELPLIGAGTPLTVTNEVGFSKVLSEGEKEKISLSVYLPSFVASPKKQGQAVGHAVYSLHGKKIADIPLVAAESVGKDAKGNLFQRLFHV